MAYSQNFPAQRPVFQFNADAGRVSPNMAFSRASTGSYFGTEKVLSSENLLLQSEDFTTTWSASEANGSAGATAPDGGTDAYTITCYTASSKSPRVNQSLSGKLSANTQYTMVGHVKAGTATHGYISFRGTNSNNYAYAQIEFASPGSVSTGGAGFTSISGTVTALGSSWYRLTLTATTGSDVSGAFAFLGPNDGTAFNISGYPTWDTAAETIEVWGAQISSTNTKVYDSPTTTQIARNYQTKLQTAASGAARFEHSASDGQSAGTSLGILVEGQSSNLVTFSEDFTNWATTRSQVESSVAVGPDGTLSADRFVEDSSELGSNSHYIQSSFTTTNSTQYTMSVYAKHGGGANRYCQLRVMGVGNGFAYSNFDLSNGTYVGGGGSIRDSYSISAVGNGWHRLTMTFTNQSSGGTVTGMGVAIAASNSELPHHLSDDYSGILLYGAQCELGALASSLVGTSGASATRASDSLTVVDSSLFDNGSGSVVMEIENVGRSIYAAVLEDDSTGNYQDYIALTVRADDKARQTVNAPGSSSQSDLFSAASTVDGSYFKIASRFAPNDFGVCIDGGTVATDTTGAVPSNVDKLFIGYYDDGGRANAHIKRVAVYSEPLSDSNLQSLTAS